MGTVVNIQRYSLGDGPGIRTTVFLKGCPLRCLWCSNPETQKAQPEVGHRESLCHHCGKCLAACKTGAVTIVDDRIHIDHEKCIGCGGCVDACLYGSMTWYGMEMNAEEVVSAVRQDEMFYGAQGGVTLSGGEVLMQAEFAAAILSGCREAGIHTAIETSGFGGGLGRLLPLLDLLIFDLKAGSSALHERLTGVPNEIIRQNLALAAESGVEVLVRYPVIPGYNDAEQDGIAAIMNDCGLSRVEIMPYHSFGITKYSALDRAYEVQSQAPEAQQLEQMIESFRHHGIVCTVGGHAATKTTPPDMREPRCAAAMLRREQEDMS